MKIRRNLLLKSFTILACLGTAIPLGSSTVYAADAEATAAAATSAADDAALVSVPTLKHHLGILQTSMDPRELGASVHATVKHLMDNPLADLSDSAQDALNSAVHVSLLTQLDLGDIIPDNRVLTPRFSDFIALLNAATSPTEGVAAYYAWLAGVVYTTEKLAMCSPNLDELKEGFVPYLRRQDKLQPAWLIEAAKKTDLSTLAERVVSARRSANLAYKTAQIEKLRGDLESRAKVPVRSGEFVFAKGTAVGNGQCGWHSAFDNMIAPVALRQLLGLVEDGTIYEPVYYEVVMRRLLATQGNALIERIISHPGFAKDHAAEIASAVKRIEALTTSFNGSLAFHNEFSPVPEELRTEPTEREAREAWHERASAWLSEHQAEFNPWNEGKQKLVAGYEQKKWEEQFELLSKFKFSQGYLAGFIDEDFNRIFEGGQLDVAQGADNYLRMLQRMNHVNINVWLARDGVEPVLVRQSRLSNGYRVANVLLQGSVGEAGVVVGHYDPLVLVSADSTLIELARVTRHERLVEQLRILQEAQAAAAAASSASVPTVIVTAPPTDGAVTAAVDIEETV